MIIEIRSFRNYSKVGFNSLFESVLDKVCPFKEVRVRSRSNLWMNPHCIVNIARFETVQRDIRAAKEGFFRQGVRQNKGDLKSLGYSKKSVNSSSNIVLEMNGDKIFDPSNVARIFNRFHTSVASNLVSRLPNPYGVYQ